MKKLFIPFGLLAALIPVAGFAVTFDVPAQELGDVAAGAVSTAAFYMSNLAAVCVLMTIALSLRHVIWGLYTLLVLLGLVYICLFEQNITGIVWTGIDIGPQSLVAGGYAMFSVNYLVAAHTLPADHKWAWLKAPFRIAAVAIWVIWGAGRLGSVELGYLLFSLTGCSVAIAHFFPVSTFTKLRGGYDTIIRNFIWIILVMVLIGGTLVIAGGLSAQNLTVTINRVIIATVVIAFGALFIRNIFVLQSDRELAVQEALERATEQARISAALLEAQKSHKAAVDIARTRTLRLATASHDIRQPLSSLRTSFAAFSRNMPEDTRSHLQTSLDYLDELASSYLTEASAEDASDEDTLAQSERVVSDADEQVHADQIAQTLTRMFENDAAERDLMIAADVASATLQTQPLALMRVLCNVMANAVAHGTPGVLQLRGETLEDAYIFSITNPGAGTLDFAEWGKGDASQGSGLGLSIVREQAARSGLEISTPDCDADTTCVAIAIPHPARKETP